MRKSEEYLQSLSTVGVPIDEDATLEGHVLTAYMNEDGEIMGAWRPLPTAQYTVTAGGASVFQWEEVEDGDGIWYMAVDGFDDPDLSYLQWNATTEAWELATGEEQTPINVLNLDETTLIWSLATDGFTFLGGEIVLNTYTFNVVRLVPLASAPTENDEGTLYYDAVTKGVYVSKDT